MHILGGVASSGSALYRLAQTYSSLSAGSYTYTVPNGVYQIAAVCVGAGGTGANGVTSSSSNGGAGGRGGGGGAVIGFWNWNVTPGQTFNIAFPGNGSIITDSGNTNSITALNGASGASGGAGGTTQATGGGFLPNRTFANGGAGGANGATKTTNGDGNNGSNGGSSTQFYDATFPSLGLPTNIYSGQGGGGGGSGARDTTGFQFYGGGAGGSPLGAAGGSAFQDFAVNGENAQMSLITAEGGSAGGGGAFQAGFGSGVGGSGALGGNNGEGLVYIYER
jgi:hypothetical protein